jgi:hypothetical protein
MESERNPSGRSRALPRATPAGATRSPSRPVPAPSTSNGIRDGVLSGTVAREAHAHEAEPESITRQALRDIYGDTCQLEHLPASQEPKRKPTKGYEQPPINRVLSALHGAGCTYRAGRGVDSWQAACPTHDDTRPSLQVRRNYNGSVWLKCWAGCSKEGILAALGLEWSDLWEDGHRDADRAKPYIKPLLPGHLRRAMEDLIRMDDERRAA